jgi:uncharacterized protein
MTKTDQRGSIVIERPECLRLLDSAAKEGRIGRLGIGLSGAPHIIPVNFSVFERKVIVRIGPGLLADHLEGILVAFEVDHAEPGSKNGWSVLVRGLAEVVPNDETARLGRDLPEPIVMHPGTRVFSIRLDAVTGRAISHDHFISDVQSSTIWASEGEL